jgi:hypothetical protein
MAKRLICPNCLHVGKPSTYIKGSFLIELFLYGMILVGYMLAGFLGAALFFIVAVGYSIYRVASKKSGCPKCEAPNMVPEDSPRGQELLARSSAAKP